MVSESKSDPSNVPLEKASSVERRAQALFEESVADLDGHTRSKLTQARHAALAAARAPGARWRHWWLPAGGFATAALAALLFLNLRVPESMTSEVPAVDDIEIIASADNLDLLEDVDFYSWLDSEPDAGSSGAG